MTLHFKNPKKRPAEKKVVGQLRRTQLITTFGSGAIVDMPEYSVILAATDYWQKDSNIIHEPNLESLLKVKKFRLPHSSENEDQKLNPDIPAFRFPYMHFCPKCGRLMPYWLFGAEGNKVCKECKRKLIPSRFIVACVNGHLEDFPYRWWVHHGDLKHCPGSKNNDKLRISFANTTGDLESIIITCKACGRSRSMGGCLSSAALKGYRCHGHRPWLGMPAKYDDHEECHATMRGLQRGASNVYFPQTISALTIPPWSKRINQEIEKHWEEVSNILASPAAEREKFIEKTFEKIIKNNGYSVQDISTEITRRESSILRTGYSQQNLYEDEYKVLCQGDYDFLDDINFKIKKSRVPDFLRDYFEEVVLVTRLREVLALRGFRRISPERNAGEDESSSDVVPLSKEPLDWYPAVEMLGEGIFIRLNEKTVKEWEAKAGSRYETMDRRQKNTKIGCENFSPRYVLLHTLAHLLIRQLSVECGYSGASLKERIYSTYPSSRNEMAGILIYTSTSDSDGSLGGLVRNGRSENFETIVRNMLQAASWCSSDPVCIEAKAQGFNSLNYAACHACTLLPETSCVMRNCLLDRCAVVGSLNNKEEGFFTKLLKYNLEEL